MQQQQRMMETMQAELQKLKATEQVATTPVASAVQASAGAGASGSQRAPAPARQSLREKLSMTVYGFAQADAIYDFKRVDPDWADTLRVTTIPTQSGAYGNDGDFLFSVRQSRLGVKGDYGPDITYKLEGELFGVGGDQGQTTLRVGMPMRPTRIS